MSNLPNRPQFITCPDDISDVGLRNLYILWDSTRSGSIGSTDMDLLEFPEIIPQCVKFRLESGQSVDDAVVTYDGSELPRVRNKDVTGMRVSELKRYPNAYRLAHCCGQEKMAMKAGPEKFAVEGKEFLFIEHVCLPLSKDGMNLSGLLYAAAFS